MSPLFTTATYAEPLDEAVLVVATSMRVRLVNRQGARGHVYHRHSTPVADDLIREMRRTRCPQCPSKQRARV